MLKFSRTNQAFVLLLSVVAVAAIGCNKGGLKGLAPVSGVVLLNGEPVAEAQLLFAPEGGGPDARSGNARTDAEGKFKAMTLKPGDGILPGKYNVSVRKMSEAPSAAEELGKVEGGEGAEEKMSDSESAKLSYLKDEVKDLLPVRYASPATSGLTLTVEKGGVAEYKIELTD